MIWIEKKYINIAGAALRNFVWRSGDVAQFSCPYCGDSETDEKKSRGYLYLVQSEKYYGYVFHCHNCSAHRMFPKFLREQSEPLYNEYRLEKFKESNVKTVDPVIVNQNKLAHASLAKKRAQESVVNVKSIDNLEVLTNLDMFHPVVQYVRSRGIPKDSWSKLFYTTNYRDTVLSVVDDEEKKKQYSNIPPDERLVLPLRTRERKTFGFIGRRISEGGMRYLTLKIDDNHPKIYGLEYHKKSQETFVLEGALDSLFLPNALALCGGYMNPTELCEFVERENTYIVLDNEPRNKDTINRMLSFVDSGFRVMIWNKINEKTKDINGMFDTGVFTSQEHAVSHIRENSFSGLAANIEIVNWKRV